MSLMMVPASRRSVPDKCCKLVCPALCCYPEAALQELDREAPWSPQQSSTNTRAGGHRWRFLAGRGLVAISRHRSRRDPRSSGPCPAAHSAALRLQQNHQRPRGLLAIFPSPLHTWAACSAQAPVFPSSPVLRAHWAPKESSWESWY